MTDRTRQSAARLAALIAVPFALLVGAAAFVLLGNWYGQDPQREPGTGTDPGATVTPGAPLSPVPMDAPALDERQEIVCRAVLSQLPDTIDGLPQRPVTAGPEQNAAYGAPPITLACGGPEPSYELTDTVYPLSGVCWHAAPQDAAEGTAPGATVWTTLGREVPVRVTVPGAYQPPGQWVIGFSPTVAATVRSTGTAPSGCHE